ncbi:MAG: hypothetical protein IJ576_04470 [Synergistaceae bacterium]|nr:hypothetical protein [Synergistaceae bacterium]MBR1418203.1 hypothetical protein [Synergistaceae bacterium]
MLAVDYKNFSQDISGYINQAVNFNEIISVATDGGGAVLMSLDDYNSLIETAYILSHNKTMQDICEGLNTAWEECIPESEILNEL